jgi:hypothetical protein
MYYVYIQKDKCTSLQLYMEKCVFIGYSSGYKGWLFYNPTTKKIIISECAEFDEHDFPGLSKSKTSLPLVDLQPKSALEQDSVDFPVPDDAEEDQSPSSTLTKSIPSLSPSASSNCSASPVSSHAPVESLFVFLIFLIFNSTTCIAVYSKQSTRHN